MNNTQGTIKAICISTVRGIQKESIDSAEILAGFGISVDAHGGDWHRQISLLSHDKIEQFRQLGADVAPGAFGENLVVEGIDFRALPVGTQLACGDVLLEITQIGKECHHRCAIYHKMGDCIMPREGVFAKTIKGGSISVGDPMCVLPAKNKLRAAILTLSDKGAAGNRADESGIVIRDMLEQTGYEIVEQSILPDDKDSIQAQLVRFADRLDVGLVLTTGGTGFSPRDITPEATLAVAERVAPGIAEAMRHNSLQITKRAMLSRGVAAIRGKTLIVNLPGSPKAVRENLEYILPELAHGIEILRGLTGECAVK